MKVVQIAASSIWTLKSDHAGFLRGEAKSVVYALCENGRVACMEPDGYRNNWRPLVAVPDGLFDAPVERRVRKRPVS